MKIFKVNNIPEISLVSLFIVYVLYKVTISTPNYDAVPLYVSCFLGLLYLLNRTKNKKGYISLFIFIVTAFVVGIPIEIIFVIFILFLVTLIVFDSEYMPIILYTLSFSLVITLFTSLLMDMDSQKTYFSGGGKYSLKSRKYENNVNDIINMPHGDLVAIDRRVEYISVPREQKFITDDRGFRNDGDEIDYNLVIVGDSFVAGNGSSQEDTLSNIVFRKYGIKPYNLGFPANLSIYKKKMKEYLEDYPDAKFIMYVFEGNDFSEKLGWDYRLIGYPLSNLTKIQNKFIKLTPYKIDDIVFNKIKAKVSGGTVSVHMVGNQQVGFFDKYTAASDLIDPKLSNSEGDDDTVLNHVICAFYIPTKYTVYKKHINNSSEKYIDNQDPKFTLLRQYLSNYDVQVVNLTHELQREADRLLLDDKYVFWRDDTHWNQYGMETVSESLYQCLR